LCFEALKKAIYHLVYISATIIFIWLYYFPIVSHSRPSHSC